MYTMRNCGRTNFFVVIENSMTVTMAEFSG